MLEYVLLIIGFLATIVAIKGETWNKNKKRFKRVTLTGIITFFLALCALIISGIVTFNNSAENIKKSKLLSEVSINTESMKDTIQELRKTLNYSNQLTEQLQDKIDIYKETLNRISSESERQPQWAFLNFYIIDPQKTIVMPNRVYSGSLLKFVGVCEGLILQYGSREIEIPAFHYSNPLEIPISGQSGASYNWSIKNTSGNKCDFKIYILSTPRSRSSRWSYEEETN